MQTSQKFWFVLGGAVLGMALIACSCASLLPKSGVVPLPTSAPIPTSAPLPTDTPAPPAPEPDLAGYWQSGPIVFTIERQENQFALTAINSAGTSTRTLESQTWDGSNLTWTYLYSDENGDSTITYTTVSVEADSLTADRSSSNGSTGRHIFRRVGSAIPDYYPLPYLDDFSDPLSGWDIYNTDSDEAGYQDGSYFVISKTNQFSSYGEPYRFFGDTVIDVDVTPVSGPAGDNFSFHIGCRIQSNADGYLFEIEADGYYAVGYYTGGGNTYKSLLSGDDWQSSNAILQGMQTNHMTVTCAGSQFKLELNGQVLFEGQDTTFSEGDLDLGAATYDDNNLPAEIHFDNLEVKLP